MLEEINREIEFKTYEEKKEWLEEYAKNNNIYDLSSEDILKLFEKSYIIKSIESAFNITSEELSKIRKEKEITNMHLEKSIRDICTILYYFDQKEEALSDKIRSKIIKLLIISKSSTRMKAEFYKKELLKFDFSKEKIKKEIEKRNIDVEYRLKKMSTVIEYLEKLINEYKKIEESGTEFPKDIIDVFFMDNNDYDENSDEISITIPINGKKEKYNVTISEEKYFINSKNNQHRENNGSHNNQKKSNDNKILNGKRGEKIVLEIERHKLRTKGMIELADKVKLVAQVNEDITLDGIGYDLISYNELGEKICIEVKTSKGEKDKPFFISKKEIEVMEKLSSKHKCKHSLIYYVLNKGDGNITIKKIDYNDFKNYQLEPILYKVVATNNDYYVNQ